MKTDNQHRSILKNLPNTVHPAGGSLRVFRQFAWLEVCSGKTALSRPAHQRVTQAVSLLLHKEI